MNSQTHTGDNEWTRKGDGAAPDAGGAAYAAYDVLVVGAEPVG